MINAAPSNSFEATLTGAPTGLTGSLGVRVVNATTGATVIARATAGIVESPASSGIYSVALTAPALGRYAVIWDQGGAITPAKVSVEELDVTSDGRPRFIWPSETFVAISQAPTAGLVGTIGVRIIDPPTGTTALARTTAGITELLALSGIYAATLTAPAVVGLYAIVWDTGTLTPTTTATEELVVGPVTVGVDLTTVTAVREFLQKPDTDVKQDAVIANLITRASRAILTWCGIEGRPTAATSHVFIYRGGRRLSLAPYVAQSVSSVVMDSDGSSPSTLTTGDWALRPKPPRDGVYRWLRIPTGGNQLIGPEWPGERDFAEREVTVTGVFGWPTVPEDVEHWCIVTVAEWLRLHVQAFSTVLNIDAGLLERPEALPSAVRAGLSHHRQVLAP